MLYLPEFLHVLACLGNIIAGVFKIKYKPKTGKTNK